MDLLREIGSNLSKQRALLADAKKDLQRIQAIQTSLQEALTGIWSSEAVSNLQQAPQQWKAFVDAVATGRIPSVAAQASAALKQASSAQSEAYWIADGKKYSAWLGGGIATLCRDKPSGGIAKEWQPVTELCSKSFYLGYTDEIVAAILDKLMLTQSGRTEALQQLVKTLKQHEQRHFLLSIVDSISKRFFPSNVARSAGDDATTARVVGGASALLQAVVDANEEAMTEHLVSWLLQASAASTGLYRSVITAMSAEGREKAMEHLWTKFCDKLLIKHSPLIQQETMTKVLLLLIGAVHRTTPMAVFMLAHSSYQTSGVSERLSSPSPRVRLLGMIFGSAVSQLVDKPETRMKFDFEGEDRKTYDEFSSLMKIIDKVGSLDDLPSNKNHTASSDKTLVVRSKKAAPANIKQAKPVSKIQVIGSDDEDENDDLVAYAKPDSDPEDSDEDPTLARRNKPKAPVYIRDLITQLGNTEEAQIQELALETAPSLIRRKADFGTELSDRAIELCSTYFELSDPFGLDDFLQLRLQGMTALLVAQPKICGPYYASTVFEGEYNLDQRVSGLTAMGLAARELAGYKGDRDQEEQFPSKTLPSRLHNFYLQDSQLDRVSSQLSSSMLNEVSTKQTRPRTKLIRNDLSKIVAEAFFFPLTGHFATHARTLPNMNKLLPTLIKTLAIIVTSAGSSAVVLPQMTSELLAFLLSQRSRASNDQAILEALLFGFLSVLNVNEDKRSLVERHSREIVEMHEWCNAVFDRVSSGLQGVSEEEERVKTLCAGVLVATKEVIESYERLMVGDLVDFGR